MKPILFLDCDGILNTRPGTLDADKLDLLAGIVRETGCEIVLSSTWRKIDSQLDRLVTEISARGLQIFDSTPVIEEYFGRIISCPARWVEISRWFERRKDLACSAFIILDDEPHMGPFSSHHVHVQSDIGLTSEIAKEVISRLK